MTRSDPSYIFPLFTALLVEDTKKRGASSPPPDVEGSIRHAKHTHKTARERGSPPKKNIFVICSSDLCVLDGIERQEKNIRPNVSSSVKIHGKSPRWGERDSTDLCDIPAPLFFPGGISCSFTFPFASFSLLSNVPFFEWSQSLPYAEAIHVIQLMSCSSFPPFFSTKRRWDFFVVWGEGKTLVNYQPSQSTSKIPSFLSRRRLFFLL